LQSNVAALIRWGGHSFY